MKVRITSARQISLQEQLIWETTLKPHGLEASEQGYQALPLLNERD
jgi:hypothetical protein